MSERCEQCNHLWQMHDRIAKGTGCQEPTGSWQECGCMKLKPSPAGTPLEGRVEHPVEVARPETYIERGVELVKPGESAQAVRYIKAVEVEVGVLKMALSLNCELHGCTSSKCTAAEYHGDAEKLWGKIAYWESTLSLAGCVKDATNPVGWRNKRAEEAEAEIASHHKLLRHISDMDHSVDPETGLDSSLERIKALIAKSESSSVPQDAARPTHTSTYDFKKNYSLVDPMDELQEKLDAALARIIELEAVRDITLQIINMGS
jgi:hypothetical protein